MAWNNKYCITATETPLFVLFSYTENCCRRNVSSWLQRNCPRYGRLLESSSHTVRLLMPKVKYMSSDSPICPLQRLDKFHSVFPSLRKEKLLLWSEDVTAVAGTNVHRGISLFKCVFKKKWDWFVCSSWLARFVTRHVYKYYMSLFLSAKFDPIWFNLMSDMRQCSPTDPHLSLPLTGPRLHHYQSPRWPKPKRKKRKGAQVKEEYVGCELVCVWHPWALWLS